MFPPFPVSLSSNAFQVLPAFPNPPSDPGQRSPSQHDGSRNGSPPTLLLRLLVPQLLRPDETHGRHQGFSPGEARGPGRPALAPLRETARLPEGPSAQLTTYSDQALFTTELGSWRWQTQRKGIKFRFLVTFSSLKQFWKMKFTSLSDSCNRVYQAVSHTHPQIGFHPSQCAL